jgi:von Willebrand factor type A domain
MPQTSPGAARPPRAAAAVLLSLAAHGALLLALAALPARTPQRALTVEPTVVEGCTLSLAPLPGPHPKPGLPDGGVRLEAEEFEVSVDALPPSPRPVPAPSPTALVKGPAEPARPVSPPGSPGAGGSGAVPGPGPGAGQGGGGGGVGLFPVPPGARSVVYVIDHSVSMGLHGALRLALNELLASLRRLPDGTQFQVVLYNHHAETLCIHHRFDLAVLDAAAREEVARAVVNLAATGGSNHREALRQALAEALRQALALGPDVLYLVTDGAEMSAAEVLAVTRLNQRPTAIHAIELGRGGRPADSPLYRLASDNRGTYRCVAPAE